MVTKSRVSRSEDTMSLKFDKSILPTVKSQISNKELINRLIALHDELSNIDDSSVNLSNYTTDLVNKNCLAIQVWGFRLTYVVVFLIFFVYTLQMHLIPTSNCQTCLNFFKQFSRLSAKKMTHFTSNMFIF